LFSISYKIDEPLPSKNNSFFPLLSSISSISFTFKRDLNTVELTSYLLSIYYSKLIPVNTCLSYERAKIKSGKGMKSVNRIKS